MNTKKPLKLQEKAQKKNIRNQNRNLANRRRPTFHDNQLNNSWKLYPKNVSILSTKT